MSGRFAVALCDDSAIFRQGLGMLLEAAGLAVVASVGSGAELTAVLPTTRADAVVLDVRMPPTHTDEGIRMAGALREAHPDLGILVLSTYAEPVWATRLLGAVPTGVGYALKDRVADVRALVDALARVAGGGVWVEPELVAGMMAASRPDPRLARLTPQERRVLALLAEGHSNEAIARLVGVTDRTVESHVAAIFRSLDLAPDASVNRRVRAALAHLAAPPPA